MFHFILDCNYGKSTQQIQTVSLQPNYVSTPL